MNSLDRPDGSARLSLALLMRLVVAVFVGVLLGLGLTIRSLDLDQRGTVVGAWRSTPRDGSGEVDPYALAANARAGLMPLGAAEGLTFVARTDDAGDALRSTCDYVLQGPMPAARFWTVSLLDEQGFPVANPADRYGFTSADILRFVGDPAVIRVAPSARSGNWLPVGKAQPYLLMLRLYDTGLSTGHADLAGAHLPHITKAGCE